MTDLGLLWRWKWSILSATVIAAVIGWTVGLFIRPVYESEINVQIGRVFDKDLADSFVVAGQIDSQAFRSGFREELREMGRRVIDAEAIDPVNKGTAAYVKIIVLGRSPESAQDLARRVGERVVATHNEPYEAALAQHVAFEETLSQQLEAAKREVTRMEETLRGLQRAPGVGAPAVLLLQAQLETRQLQLIDLAGKLRDARIERANETRKTRIMAPPSEPISPVWPRKTLIAVVAGGLAFLVAVLIVVLGGQAGRRL